MSRWALAPVLDIRRVGWSRVLKAAGSKPSGFATFTGLSPNDSRWGPIDLLD